ncbi:MAG TPA: serine/threonine protein kinase [Rhizobacter sp.]|nr:serine/threonine protein kinase [Rhizobacter sp.]
MTLAPSTPAHIPSDTPFAGLTPEAVLDALDSVGLRGDGRLIQLNSYENRVFQVFLEDERVVVAKFYRPNRWTDAQILEEHGFATELEAHEIPVVAPWPLCPEDATFAATTLASFQIADSRYRFSVSPRKSGRAPELEDMGTLAWLGRFIGRLHAVGAQASFKHRLTLDVPTYGAGPRDWLLSSGVIPIDAQPQWQQIVDQALGEVQRCFDAAGDYPRIRLHGDCHTGNVLWTQAGPHFVDLDDALTGPAMQDLWMLLSGDRAAMQQQLNALLSGYEDFMDFDWRQVRLIEALRTLRMIHYSAWIGRRWNDPAFPLAFPWFGGRSYWDEQATRLLEQVDTMQQQPAASGLPY